MMKRYAMFVFLVGMVNQVTAEDSLKVMTYNLEGMKPGTDPQTRIYHAIQYLKQLDPDIIGVQEINETPPTGSDNQAKAIADSLAAHFHTAYYVYMGFTHLSWDNQFNEYVGIISKYPVEKKGYFDLVKGAFPRKVLWNQINTHIGAVNFFNTHLDHQTASVRVQQVQQIIRYIAQKDTSSPAIASILTGDFNDEPNTTTILSLTNTGNDTAFIDSYRSANPSSPGYTVSSNSPSRRIDYIFCKNTGTLNITKSMVVMNTPYSSSNYPSDHLGVITVFKKNITNAGSNVLDQTLKNIELYQNYPNPFNPTTTISYYVPQAQNVTLKIYNSLGQTIRNLVSENQHAGLKNVVWNGRDDHSFPVASGVYLVQLNGNGVTKTQKIFLMK